MDKYTVDLDKVLNDFEYSELTDNFGASKTYHAQGSSNYASSSKSKTGDTKHSITNVFHSLNEYLNTDISTNTTKIHSDNKETYVVPNISFLPTTKNKDVIAHSSISIDSTLKKLEINETNDVKKSDLICSSELINDNSKEIGTLLDLTLEGDYLNDNKELQPEVINNGEKSNTIENLLDLDDDESRNELSQVNAGIINEHNLLNLNFIISTNDHTPTENLISANENLVEETNDTEVAAERTEMPVEENEECVDIRNEVCQISTTETINGDQAINESISDSELNKNNVINGDQDINKAIFQGEIRKTNNVVGEKQQDKNKDVISFENAVDLDDSLLNKYLDELEDELQNENEEQHEPFIENNEKGKVILETEEIVNNENIDDAVENKSEHVSEEKVTTENNPGISAEVVAISESVSVNKNSTNSDISEKVDQNDTESITSMERPKVLELNASVDETCKREIDLIGNPGSTPYNNVYISKELQTTSHQKESSSQEDSDTSPSVSPTFSEASTEVLTDSTETDSEDDVKTDDVNRQKQEDVATSLQDETTPINETFSMAEPSAGASSISQDTSNSVEMENACVASSDTNVQPTDENSSNANTQDNIAGFWLGKAAPVWLPDSEALSCLHCDARFTVIKRRHHCRACGLVLCSKCCNLKYRLEYLDAEARVCSKCYIILNMDTNSSSGSEVSQTNSPNKQPNPNNPMEYCSVVPPLQQVGQASQNPPTVMVPVGVLKRKGSAKGKSNKSVMFCDGIRPGSDLTKLDADFNYSSQVPTSGSSSSKTPVQNVSKINRNIPSIDPQTKSFIPSEGDCLPPTVTVFKSDITYVECMNGENIVETLKCEKLTFALQRNLHVHVKIINMDCCINKKAWCFCTDGLISVGQDEIVYIIELIEDEKSVPVDIFHHINHIYNDAVKGTTVTEMGLSLHNNPNMLGFKNHAGFLYIRPTFQCLQNIIRPTEPYLIGLLIHRWEAPWAKIFPLRLVLRLGAEYRYYPSPIISTRHRDSVFVEIGHTIINILADFRNFSFTLPNIRGLTIHMEDKNTTVTIPENRYDQVMKSLNNSSDHILSFGGNFSTNADSHLVCVQDTQASSENSYTTHAINILNKPRKVTGASFIVFNGALKSSSGLTAKSSIIEDGLMIQIPPENMTSLRESLRNMKNYTIQCGCINAPSDETVNIIWGKSDTNFNIGVTSPIDNQPLSGVPSIRVHNGKNFVCNSGNRLIRWTEVFILQNTYEQSKTKDPIDISKIAESISKATCQALVKYLDLLTSNNFYKIGIRTTLHVENVSYSAGSNNIKLPPIYMKNLDNELIPVLHLITSNNLGENAITLELIFRILNT